jgi:hypothetical protein
MLELRCRLIDNDAVGLARIEIHMTVMARQGLAISAFEKLVACPANKLVITPFQRIPANAVFKVTVFYTGRPGVHTDGDGSTEGWFRNDVPPGDGGFVTIEPVGTEAWMPLNNHPSAKPTYDFYDTATTASRASPRPSSRPSSTRSCRTTAPRAAPV